MRKLFFLMISAFSFAGLPAQSLSTIYQLSFPSLQQTPVNISSFSGKKLLVLACDASHPDRDQLLSLNTWAGSHPTVTVIVVPVSDFDSAFDLESTTRLWQDTLSLSCLVTGFSKAQKQAGSSQHPLLQWVTHKDRNSHFDNDIAASGEMFWISGTGRLYACMKSKVAMDSPAMSTALAATVPDK